MIKRQHICLLTTGRIFEILYGGEERFTISLGNWLAKQTHEVTLMGSSLVGIKTKHLSKFAQEENDEKITMTARPKKIRTLSAPYFVFLPSRLLKSLLWTLKILSINIKSPMTAIHSQDTGYAGLAAVISGRILRIPVIVSSHGIRHKTLELNIHSTFKKILLKVEYSLDLFTIKNADGIIAVNSSIKNYYEQIASKEIKIKVIPIPIKLKHFEFSQVNRETIRKDLGIDKKTIVIGFVGRLSPEKNLLTLLISFAYAVKKDPLLKLILVGSGPLEAQLKKCISERGINDKVIFCGTRYDIGKILSGFDIFVLPSYTEGLSTALLEAMASGRAVICSDIPANHELVTHNKEALLINPYNPEELERAIQLLSNDYLLRLKLGNNAKIKASQYDEDIVFPNIVQYYNELCRKKNDR